jgi:hypothetical protein
MLKEQISANCHCQSSSILFVWEWKLLCQEALAYVNLNKT